MMDIVQRLRQFAHNPHCEEAADEIERLRTQCEGLAQSAMNNGQELLLREREIESLKQTLRAAANPGWDNE